MALVSSVLTEFPSAGPSEVWDLLSPRSLGRSRPVSSSLVSFRLLTAPAVLGVCMIMGKVALG